MGKDWTPGAARRFSQAEYEDRWARVYAEMRRRGYETAVVWGKSAGTYERSMDMLYLTNFYSSHSGQEPDTPAFQARSFSGTILHAGEEPEVHSDEFAPRLDRMATERHVPHLDPIKGVADALRARGIEGKVAWVGGDVLPVKYGKQIEAALPGIEFVYEDDLVATVRRVKSPAELEVFREAGDIADAAMTEVMNALTMGRTEAEAAGAGIAELMRRGGGFQRVSISHGALCHMPESSPMYGFSTTAPEPGEMFHVFVWGPILEGYWLDPGRTGVCGGKPTPEQRRLVEDCARILEEGIEAKVRPGANMAEITRSAMAIHDAVRGDRCEYDANWPYYGHSNGCMWEQPLLNLDCLTGDEVYQENMVCSSEAFLTREGVGTATFENNFIVTRDGIEMVTKIPMYWW
ncbi:MAG: M24 family metallopeptidase [Azospirillaceae bacterium]